MQWRAHVHDNGSLLGHQHAFVLMIVKMVEIKIASGALWSLRDTMSSAAAREAPWRQTLFRFYLYASWKFSEQSFSLKSMFRMEHIFSSISCNKNNIILAFSVAQKSEFEYGYLFTRFSNWKRRFCQAALRAKRQRVWWLMGETDPGRRYCTRLVVYKK